MGYKTYEDIKEYFLNRDKISDDYRIVFDKIESLEKNIFNFTNKDLDDLLFNLDSISVNSVDKNFRIIREIIRFASAGKMIKPTRDMSEYINKERLLSKTIIFPEEYIAIKNEILEIDENQGYGVRDKVVFCLACEGLTNREITNLKMSDIEFLSSDLCKLNLITKRTVIINNEELIWDIKQCIRETKYIRTDINGRKMLVDLRMTPYLIRPIATRQGNNIAVSNLGQLFEKIMKRVRHDRVDTENVTVEDIRRSLAMYWLGCLKANTQDVSLLLGKKNNSDLYWLEKFAKEIYEDRC